MVIAGFALLAAAGAIVRWGLTPLNADWLPYGTLAVNVVGAFVLGVLHGAGGDTATLVGVALLGSLSTFSTVISEVVDAVQTGNHIRVCRYLALTVLLGVLAAWVGLQLS